MQSARNSAMLIAAYIGLLTGCGGPESTQVKPSEYRQPSRSDKTTTTVASDYQTVVQELYISYFGRPADPAGLTNFENALFAANAPTDIQDLSNVYATNSAVQNLINAFGNSKESQNLYGSGSASEFVTAVFQNVLGRAPQHAGLTYWSNAISSGALSQGDAALAIMAGAFVNTSPQGLLDAQLINNRIAVADYFTAQVSSQNDVSAYAGSSAAADARAMLSTVSATTNPVAFEPTVNYAITSIVGGAASIGPISPASNLLAPGSTSVAITFQTSAPTTCGYSLGSALPFAQMQPIDSTPTISHASTIQGLDPTPTTLNQVYVSCAAEPSQAVSVIYRAVAAPSGSYPRIGSIWWGSQWISNDPAHAKQMQIMLCPGLTGSQINAQRAISPNTLFLLNVTATSSSSFADFTPAAAPDSYFLHDVNGNKILIWPPNSYVWNMTNPQVAEYVAQLAYTVLANDSFAWDGIFFDSFQRTISSPMTDFYGNSLQISSQNNGVADDPISLNAAWGTGVQHLLTTFKGLVPYGYTSGHIAPTSVNPLDLAGFNGNALLGPAVDIREGIGGFSPFFQSYTTWETQSLAPPISMVQASPPNQISYGYSYVPAQIMTPALLAWAQTTYANMRFGLGIATLGNGYFSYDIGDNSSGVTWWYDEYDFNLGTPAGNAVALLPTVNASQLINNGNFSSGLSDWVFYLTQDGSANASVAASSASPTSSGASADISIVEAGTYAWHIDLEQDQLSLVAGTDYRLSFMANSDVPLSITVTTQGGSPNYLNYGLAQQFSIAPGWQTYTIDFIAPIAATDGRLEFQFGSGPGHVWLTNVSLISQQPQIYQRDFTNGVVIVNGTGTTQTVPLESGLQHFTGAQAPKYDVITDDSSTSFQATGAQGAGSWNVVNVGSVVGTSSSDSAQSAPYYHAWQGSLHASPTATDTASWQISIPATDSYSFQTWLPAATTASSWTTNAIYSLVVNGVTIATTSLNQSSASGGDQWWPLFSNVQITGPQTISIQINNGASGVLVADAVEMTSKARYNDGAPASIVTLAPFDAIFLQRTSAAAANDSQLRKRQGLNRGNPAARNPNDHQ